jgi:geranylgeranyl diphosphate synthase type I
MYDQYIGLAEQNDFNDAYHIGEALGICAGDIAYFLAFELLGDSPLSDRTKATLVALCAKELSHVGVAQMVDVFWGADKTAISVDDVLHLYTYKTARYTFSLPLMNGGIAAEQDERTITSLEQIGTYMGIIFQIKDDQLGMFGGIDTIGKPIGSDVREGKKTLFYHYLMEDSDREIRKRVSSLFGKQDLDDQDMAFIRERIQALDINEKIEATVQQLATLAEAEIERLECKNLDIKKILLRFLQYSLERTR